MQKRPGEAHMGKSPLLMIAALMVVSERTHALDLSWLTGRWCSESGGDYSEENWGPGLGDLMLGTSKTIAADGKVGFEFLRIEITGATAAYFAQPGGRPATRFDLIAATAASVIFANAAHDFPQRIGYRRAGTSLHVWIDDGTDDGQALHWDWHRCDS
jgi:Domain of unknown function (DUF6265)